MALFDFLKGLPEALARGLFGPLTSSVAKVGAAGGMLGEIGGSEVTPDPGRPSRPVGPITPAPEIEQMRQFLVPMLQKALAGQQQQGEGLLPRTGFLGRHPRFAGGLEGFLAGAALTGPTSTPGEAISGISRAVLGIPQLQRQARMQRAEEPMNLMKEMVGLRELESNMAYRDVQRRQLEDTIGRDRFEGPGLRVSGPEGGFKRYNRRTGRMEFVPGSEGLIGEDEQQGTEFERHAQALWDDMTPEERAPYRSYIRFKDAKRIEDRALLSGASTTGRVGATPGFMSEAESRFLKLQSDTYRKMEAPLRKQLSELQVLGMDLMPAQREKIEKQLENLQMAFDFWYEGDKFGRTAGVPFDERYVNSLKTRERPAGEGSEDPLEQNIEDKFFNRLDKKLNKRGQ